MQKRFCKPFTAGVAAAAIAAGAWAPVANADEEFILAHAMNTDHVFHAISERFLAELETPVGSRSHIIRAATSGTGCRCLNSPCRVSSR